MMLITSQCFPSYSFMVAVVWADLIFGFMYITAFTPSFGSHCFHLGYLKW